MHDFYPSHMHQGHMPSLYGHATPPHQIHNPTPSYPSHSAISTPPSPSSYHMKSETHSNIGRNDSPNGSTFASGMQLPPTPNSLLTLVGPNSGNSNNSNEACTPAETIETIASVPSQLSLHGNHHYTPWSTSNVSSSVMPPLSPPESLQTLQSSGQMHHTHIPSGLPMHHNNPPPFMQQSLPNFSHSASKTFGMPQPYYSWY